MVLGNLAKVIDGSSCLQLLVWRVAIAMAVRIVVGAKGKFGRVSGLGASVGGRRDGGFYEFGGQPGR